MDNVQNTKKFICEKCDYKTSRESQWNRHILTSKHTLDNITPQADSLEKVIVKNNFICVCGKVYSYVNGLYKHKKKCHIYNNLSGNTQSTNKMTDKEIIMMLIKDNNEFKNNKRNV